MKRRIPLSFLMLSALILFSSCNLIVDAVITIQDMTSPAPNYMDTVTPTPEPSPVRPVLYSPGIVNNTMPNWSWSTSNSGTGLFRYKFDDFDLSYGATETNSMYCMPVSAFSEGSHILYLQEELSPGNWSETVSGEAIIDLTAPATVTSRDMTSGMDFIIEGSASDLNGIASYNWSVYSGPGYAYFSDSYSPSTIVSFDTDGNYTLMLTACDSAGNSNSDYIQLVKDSSAQMYYAFNGNSMDSSGKGRDANPFSSPLLTYDRNGYGNSAYVVDMGYFIVPPSSQPDLSAGFTIAAWIKRNNNGASTFQCIIGNNYIINFGIGINYLSQRFYISIGGQSYSFSSSYDPTVYIDNTWHHFAVTFNNSMKTLELYYDGYLTSSLSCPATLPPNPTDNLGIGKDGKNSDSFAGEIDDLYIYDRVLNSSEIHDLYFRP
ncbi:MAG: LamG domain-containing protein [Spirochaetales bacterium]|nr:LamG domain-containing protein [Spirochaetales bacterium]